MKRAAVALALVAAIGGGAAAWYGQRGGPEVGVTSAPITRGDIVDTVGATGALQAVTTVLVGSQVSGNIQWLGADFNSIVRRGQVIARLDPSIFDAQLQQVEATLSQMRANVVKAQSDLDRAKVQLVDAQQKFTRANELATRRLLAQSELDAAQVAVDTAQAAVASQQATVTQVRAAVTQAEASVNQARVNREHTIITAPIDGIVTQRNVDVGQTVAASMQAPTLFVIAADLKQMQVLASVDEADVGRIRPNQRVTFRVDAYPTETFDGTVSQVRLQPTVVQNVTTYGTLITAPNPQLKLKPGMTATVKIEVARRANALRVSNLALRFRPTGEMFAALGQTPPTDPTPGAGRGGRTGPAGRDQATPRADTSPVEPATPPSAGRRAVGPRPAATGASPSPQAQTIDELFAPVPPIESRGRLWLFVDRQLKPVNVRLGITDGSFTELLGGDLQENAEVVTGLTGVTSARATPAPGGAANPLIPGRGPGGPRGGR
jgi:HlyD family secretion protein